MKILLVNPPLSRLKEILNDYFPLGLGYIAAVLRASGFEVMIYNAEKGPEEKKFVSFGNLSRLRLHEKYLAALENKSHYVWEEIRRILTDYHPDVLGIGTMSVTYPAALKIAAISKELNPKCVTVLGGPHPTALPDEVLNHNLVDFVVRGEGEDTIVELCDVLRKAGKDFQSIDGLSFKKDGGIVHNKERKLIEDLDRLPFPARDLVMFKDLYLYPNNRMNSLIASRGCPYDCTFCQARFLWKRRVRFRSVENIIQELKEIKGAYHPEKATFWDDSFTVKKQFVIDLCRRMREEKIYFEEGWNCETRVDIVDKELLRVMKDGGCSEVYIGIESGSEKILKAIHKNISVEQVLKAANLLNRMGFTWLAFFMIGFPDETRDDIELTKKLMRKLKADRINLCIFTPYPGSELYNQVVKMGLFPENADWAKLAHQSTYNYFSPLIPRDEFEKIVIDVAELTEKMNNRMLTSLRRAYNKRGIYLKSPQIFLRGLARNLKIIQDGLMGKI